MLSLIPGFSGDIPFSAVSLLSDIEGELNSSVGRILSISDKFNLVAVNIIVLDKKIGTIDNCIQFKKSQKELWISFNGDYEKFIAIDSEERRIYLLYLIYSSLLSLPSKFITDRQRELLVAEAAKSRIKIEPLTIFSPPE